MPVKISDWPIKPGSTSSAAPGCSLGVALECVFSVSKVTSYNGYYSNVTREETSRIKAGDLANQVAQQCGGRGGGRPDMAQAGGNQPEALPGALDSVEKWLQDRL